MSIRRWCLVTLGLTFALAGASTSSGQSVGPELLNWRWFDPVADINARIYGQAELVRAQGEFAVDIATARNLHAQAVDQELDNWKKYVEKYWERKVVRQRAQLELEKIQRIKNKEFLNDQKARNQLAWDRLANHPELTGPRSVLSGKALNFLLHRLSSTLSAVSYTEESEFGPETLARFKLSPAELHALRLKQPGPSGTALIFRADDPTGLDFEWWPYLLRFDEFAGHRQEIKRIRKEMVEQARADGEVSVDKVQELEDALMELTRQFYARHEVNDWLKHGMDKYQQFHRGELFLQGLARQVSRLQETGQIKALRGKQMYDPRRDGEHLLGLLIYMIRNGLQFAPATAGEEFAYNRAFRMMRDLYLVVADTDEGAEPKDLTDELE